jgi:hypothetical protein
MIKYAFHFYTLFIAIALLIVSFSPKCFQISADKFGVNRTRSYFKLLRISGFILFGALAVKLIVIFLG